MGNVMDEHDNGCVALLLTYVAKLVSEYQCIFSSCTIIIHFLIESLI